jgi:membrane-associated protein
MDKISMMNLIDIFLNIDVYLKSIVQEYSTLTYAILFLVIFIETGLVVMPFLPGDSLLFAVGALTAGGVLNVWLVFLTVLSAAILGDTANYHIGKFTGPKIFRRQKSVFFRRDYLLKAKKFYEKHGGKAIIIARFVPVIRTFAPFVAGIGTMRYRKFLAYNAIGGMLWCSLFVFGGYLFGNIPAVQKNFSIVVITIIIVSLLPMAKELTSHAVERHQKTRS